MHSWLYPRDRIRGQYVGGRTMPNRRTVLDNWQQLRMRRREQAMLGYGPIKFLLAAIATLASGAAAGQDRAADRVSVRADVFFYGAHVPIMVGIVDGIYKRHGI